MYVDDVTDMAELAAMLAETKNRLAVNPANEQAQWDAEDIRGRMAKLAALSASGRVVVNEYSTGGGARIRVRRPGFYW